MLDYIETCDQIIDSVMERFITTWNTDYNNLIYVSYVWNGAAGIKQIQVLINPVYEGNCQFYFVLAIESALGWCRIH